jgi:hypothetical protein
VVALAVAGCGDLVMEPDRVPGSITVAPLDTLILQGEGAQLRVTVLDQDGDPFPSYPSWAPPRWTPSDPAAVAISPDGQVEGLAGGDVRVQATLGGFSAWTNVRVNPLSVVISAPTVYLIQSTQNLVGDVPIVAGRRALLRVFTTGDRPSFYQPRARATFYIGGDEVYSVTMDSDSDQIPQVVDESRIDRSFNAVIPGDVLRPGVEMVVDLNADDGVPAGPGSQTRVPADGRMALDVRALPRMDLTVVPVLLQSDPDPQIFNWTGDLDPEGSTLRFARSVLPIGDLDVEVRDPYTTTADLTTTSGWNALLREIRVLRIEEGSDRYYYGAIVIPHGSRYGGLGYLGDPISVGAPKVETLAHELGHNLSLRHAPCGSVASSDPNYPHSGGSTGVWGYDFRGGSGFGWLVSPKMYKDLMGYCTPRWVSDYHFKKALNFRLEDEGTGISPAPRTVLLLWGSAGGGELLLEPVFALDAPPVLPTEEGPYRLDGYDVDGNQRFSMSFAPTEVALGGGHFAFAVPVEPDWAELLDSVVLSGPEGVVTVDRSTRLGRMTLVTDGDTGRIRAILRDGATPSPVAAGSEVLYSEGLPGRLAPRDRE